MRNYYKYSLQVILWNPIPSRAIISFQSTRDFSPMPALVYLMKHANFKKWIDSFACLWLVYICINLQLKYHNSGSGNERCVRLAPAPNEWEKRAQTRCLVCLSMHLHRDWKFIQFSRPVFATLGENTLAELLEKGYVGTPGTTLHRCSFRKQSNVTASTRGILPDSPQLAKQEGLQAPEGNSSLHLLP